MIQTKCFKRMADCPRQFQTMLLLKMKESLVIRTSQAIRQWVFIIFLFFIFHHQFPVFFPIFSPLFFNSLQIFTTILYDFLNFFPIDELLSPIPSFLRFFPFFFSSLRELFFIFLQFSPIFLSTIVQFY